MKNPSAARDSGRAAPGKNHHSTSRDQPRSADGAAEGVAGASDRSELQAVEEGIAVLGRFEEAFSELQAGMKDLPIPGR